MDLIAKFVNSIYMPITLIVLAVGYGVYLIVTKNVSSISRNSKGKVFKDPDRCAVNSGYLMFLLAGGCIVMMIIEAFLGTLPGTIVFLIIFGVFGFLWKKNLNENGPM